MDIIKMARELGAAIQQDERYLNFKKDWKHFIVLFQKKIDCIMKDEQVNIVWNPFQKQESLIFHNR